MIGIVAAMIRVRATHAVIIALLALLAVGSAVAAPRYVEASRDSVTRVDLAAADATSLTILSNFNQITALTEDPRTQQQAVAQRAKDFTNRGTAALTIPGFTTTFAVGFYARMSTTTLPDIPIPTDVPAVPQHWLEFRDGVCGHLKLTAGRCPGAAGEVVVGTLTAAELGARPGSPLHLQNMQFFDATVGEGAHDAYWLPTGRPAALTVVGVYAPVDSGDRFFTGAPPVVEAGTEPVYTDRRTVAAVDHNTEVQRVLAYPDGMSAEQFAALTPRIRAALNTIRTVNTQPQTTMPALLDQIEADRAQVGVLPGVLELPLVVLCCFVIFLAASNTAQARRTELGMLKLRGASGADRFALAAGELVAPLVAGGVLGYVVGQVAVWLFARLILTGPTPFAIRAAYLVPAGLSLLAVVVAGLLGLRRDLVAPVAELLRRVPARTARWGSVVLRTLVVVLGAAAVYQVHSGDQPLSGLGVLAPAAVILAVALVLTTVFDPMVGATGRRALRRGRIGAALALLHLGRRRTGSRVVALLGVAVGLLTFVAIAFGTGTQARTDQVVARLGARQVVSVPEMSTRELMYRVRKADPDGRYAMAVMPIGTGAPILAVDSPRLNVVGPWPNQNGGGLDVAGAQAALRPAMGRGVDVTGSGITVAATIDPPSAKERMHLSLVLVGLDGGAEKYVRLEPTSPGADTYHADVTCPVGCRMETLSIEDFEPRSFTRLDSFSGSSKPQPVTLSLSRIVQSGPDQELAGPADLATWVDRHQATVAIAPAGTGAKVTVGQIITGSNLPAWIGPPDRPDQIPELVPTGLESPPLTVPVPVPAVSPNSFYAAQPSVAVRLTGRTPVLPQVGAAGVLVDMEYLTRMGEPGPARTGGQIWLGPNAPADALDRLRAVGLTITGARSYDAELKRASGAPNATGLQFLLAVGLLCLALGAGGLGVAATVELRARAEELRSLRRQGASRWVVARAGWQSYLVIVAGGAVVGAIAAAASWFATRGSLPVVDRLVDGVTVPSWPGLIPVWAFLGAVAVLAGVAVTLSAALSAATRTALGSRTIRTAANRRSRR
jgi:hypothetical protein